MEIDQEEALGLIKKSQEAVLATLEDEGPFTSAANYFWQSGKAFGKMVFLMSDLARHAKNAAKNPRVSFHVSEISQQPLYQRRRVSAQGKAVLVKEGQTHSAYKQQYLSLFPQAAVFFTLADFHFYEMEIEELYFIGGFGKAKSFSGS